jgi:transcription termination/antitermination protein NusG
MAKSKKIEELEDLEEDLELDNNEIAADDRGISEEDITGSAVDAADIAAEKISENESGEMADTDEVIAVSKNETFSDNGTIEITDPSRTPKWYVVHTYSGHENKVKVNIEKIVENRGMQDLVLNIVVPTEDRVEINKDGQRKIKTRKMFPGYVIVKMIITNESWYLVRNTQGVTGFVGHGSEPVPLTNEEVRRMGIEKITIRLDVEPGDSVKVINGPFESFMGIVEDVNMEKQTLKVKISMFGRETPVELEFGQVDKL